MEEELSENELEGHIYSMLHYKDNVQENLNVNQKDVLPMVHNAPRKTLRRYWQTAEQRSVLQTVDTQKGSPANKNLVTENTESRPMEDNSNVIVSHSPTKLSIFQCPAPQDVKRTISILENDDHPPIMELISSDDDEVVEVALPPKPTIMIESSDEDEVCAITEQNADIDKNVTEANKKSLDHEREVLTSPVPSVVSSVSDEFIKGDCIALNISSRRPNNQSFDFSLHGSDLLGQTHTKKKKKKKNKDSNTSTLIMSIPTSGVSVISDKEECFATPKSKAKNKRLKTKTYLVSEKSIPNPDVYDSDSNQSSCELSKNPPNSAAKTVLSTDVYESDSNQFVVLNEAGVINPGDTVNVEDTDPNASRMNRDDPKHNYCLVEETADIVDLTDLPEQDVSTLSIDENIVMANVTGFFEPENIDNNIQPLRDAPMFGSTKVPAILYADLDFNNLNGKERATKKQRYSLTALRAEMEKFYNESWGGENFNHREIQKYMSRDKSLWVIDPKDRISAFSKKKVTCNYCNRQGHRDDTCRLKPPVCYMCGSIGHNEPRCPRKICVNCGSPNHMYSSMCRNCFNWSGTTCAECGQGGHPSSHCPDLWRRYHNTISENTELEENHQSKKHHQMFCSGCTRRGHLVHSCRVSLPFSGLPINSPYVTFYNPVYPPTTNNNIAGNVTNQQQHRYNQQDETITTASTPHRADGRNKRPSKSPVVHETHVNKKRNLSSNDAADISDISKSPINNGQKRKISQNKVFLEDVEGANREPNKNDPKTVTDAAKSGYTISMSSGNHDKQGQMIQDNEVSDTSDVVTSARIYITDDILDRLCKNDGQEWLNKTSEKNNIAIEKQDGNSFVSIKGTVGDQEAFQVELRDWIKNKVSGDIPKSNNPESALKSDQSFSDNIPKNRNHVLRVINKALDSLNEDLGDPKALFKELNYLQQRHLQLTSQKAVSTKQLTNNRSNMNSVLRKLNVVLLGQAGLADGPKHLNELCSLHEKIKNFKQKNIPPHWRAEIGQHFHSIFTSTPRKDYEDLLNKYYLSKGTHAFSKNKNARFKFGPKPNQNCNGNQMWLNKPIIKIDGGINAQINNPQTKRPLVEKTMNKLVFYHRRLKHARPIDAVLKKTQLMLVKELHANISFLLGNPYASLKSLKKTRRIQEQAQLFLANV